MQKACEADIAAFHDELRSRIVEQFPGGEIGEEVTKKSRSWWVKLPIEKPDAIVPYVYTPVSDIKIVAERRLRAGVWWWDGMGSGEKEQLNAAADSIRFPANCKVDRAWGVFAMTIDLGDEPFAAAVEPLRMLLAAIHEVRVRAETGRVKRG
jgi:hypothetical protein